jgi:hypothetical protein
MAVTGNALVALSNQIRTMIDEVKAERQATVIPDDRQIQVSSLVEALHRAESGLEREAGRRFVQEAKSAQRLPL